jgi:GNAT superfamily N-acetyltransferase
MVDRTIKFVDLFMLFDDLSQTSKYDLPEGYSYRYFDGSQNDIDQWAEIVHSSGDAKTLDDAYNGFNTYLADYIEQLNNRIIFVLDSNTKPVGTSTAFFIVKPQPGLPKISEDALELPKEVTGHLHWVAIREENKGKGLSKPMITRTMEIMEELGHKSAFLHTQTPSWLACKIYLDLGWKPFRFVQSVEDYQEGWKLVNEKIESLK